MEQFSLKQSESSFFIGPTRGYTTPHYDDDLAVSASAGCETSFTELLTRHRRMVIQVIRRYFDRPDEIEDLAQITFIEAWVAINSYRGRGPHSFASWLARIAVTSCFDELRRRRRRREDVISQLGEKDGESSFEGLTAHFVSDRIEHSAINRNLAGKLMMLLEPDDRLAFLMLKAEDFSIAEIARVIGWSETKVKMRIHRAKSILQRKVKRLT